MLEYISSFADKYSFMWKNDFNRGYLCGVGIVLLLILAVLVIKVIFVIAFRSRRCKKIEVLLPDGDLEVSLKALTDSVHAAMSIFSSLRVRDVRLSRSGKKNYGIELRGDLDASGTMGFPEELPLIKHRVLETLQQTFGIKEIRKVRVRVEKVSGVKVPEGNNLPAENRAAGNMEAVPDVSNTAS